MSTIYNKTCPICGSTFETLLPQKSYCSSKCRKRAEYLRDGDKIRAKTRRYRKEHPGWDRDYQKQYRADHAEGRTEYNRAWKKANPDKVKANRERWDSKPETREWKRNYAHNKVIKKRQEKAQKLQERLAKEKKDFALSAKIVQDEYVESIGIFRTSVNDCHCMRCGHDFILCKDETHAKLYLDSRKATGKSLCPYCGEEPLAVSLKSSPEDELANMWPEFSVRGYRPDWLCRMELDLYCPERKIGIEFNGVRWHSERYQKDRKYHEHKADLCEQNGVQLIQIWETEWNLHRECVIDRIDAILHREMNTVHARKTKVEIARGGKELMEAGRFLNVNHIQGNAAKDMAVVLRDNDGIVAVCSFRYGTGYAGSGHNQSRYWELNRYATRLHTVVQGGLSKCIAAFWKAMPDVDRIVSFADRRWTSRIRTAYASSGFVETGKVAANYQYTDLKSDHELKNKQFMRKSTIAKRNPEVYSADKTETEMAHELGWWEIWDAGKIRYEMTRP